MTFEIVRKLTGSHGNYTTVRISEEVNMDDSTKIAQMKAIMDQFMPDVAEEDAEEDKKSDPAPIDTPRVKRRNAKITNKQISFIERLLNAQKIALNDFCARHSVKSLNELNRQDGDNCIKELQQTSISKSN